MFLTRWFGVTESDTERNFAGEKSAVAEIATKSLLMQTNAAVQQHRPLCRGTHAKGVCARARFEVFDVTFERDPVEAARLAKGIFAKPGVYPAVVRFANADPNINSDFKPDVRSLSFSVNLAGDREAFPEANPGRQDFSLQNATTLPINDAPAFLATMKLLTASNQAAGLWSLPVRDKLRVLRTLALAQLQARQAIRPYQQLRYWSTVPFRHGPIDVVKYSAAPSPDNPARPLQRRNPKGLQDELIRHLREDRTMGRFDFGIQFLDADKMTYWGKHRDADFWIENASVEWSEAEAPFHTVARLTLLPRSRLGPEESDATYFDVTGHSTPDSTPLGSINRARWPAEVASRKARLTRAVGSQEHLEGGSPPAGQPKARSMNHAREEAGASPRGLGDAVPARRTSRLRNGRWGFDPRRTAMKHLIISLSLAAGFMALSTMESSAVVCARGVYHAGCVATGGAVAVGRPVARAAVIAPRRVAVRRRAY